jgi:hypothetical protein
MNKRELRKQAAQCFLCGEVNTLRRLIGQYVDEQNINVTLLCEALNVSRRTFYNAIDPMSHHEPSLSSISRILAELLD